MTKQRNQLCYHAVFMVESEYTPTPVCTFWLYSNLNMFIKQISSVKSEEI